MADSESRQLVPDAAAQNLRSELAGVQKCAMVATITSDDLASVAIGLAASGARTTVQLVLRLGDGDVTAETDSLPHMGRICDAHELAARAIASDVMRAAFVPA